MEWSSKVSKKYVSKDLSQEIHDKAAPFLTWLKEAEEEESESDEEDDDLEVGDIDNDVCFLCKFTSITKDLFILQIEYDDRAKQSFKPQQSPPASTKPVENDSDEEGDFDIDAI